MATLYEINSQIMECIDTETGEILDVERLNALQMERTQKIENVALYIKELKADAEAIKAEAKALTERAKQKEATADRLKQWLTDILDGSAFETAKVKLSFRKSQKINISDEYELLSFLEAHGFNDCIKYKQPEISKTELTKLLKEGQEIPFAVLEASQNLQIK